MPLSFQLPASIPRAAALAALVLLLLLPAPAHGENLGPGGGTRIITGDEVIGPYRLLITSAPEPATVGAVTFVVRASDPATGEKLRDLDVTVELRLDAGDAVLRQAATHDNAGNPVDYAAHIAVEQPGSWQGTIRARGPAGEAQVTFLQRVLPQRRLGTLLGIGLPFLAILVGLALFWLHRSRQRDAPAQP